MKPINLNIALIIAFVVPVLQATAQVVPNDPLYANQQEYIRILKIDSVWTNYKGTTNQKIYHIGVSTFGTSSDLPAQGGRHSVIKEPIQMG